MSNVQSGRSEEQCSQANTILVYIYYTLHHIELMCIIIDVATNRAAFALSCSNDSAMPTQVYI